MTAGWCEVALHADCVEAIDDLGLCACPCHLVKSTVDLILGGGRNE